MAAVIEWKGKRFRRADKPAEEPKRTQHYAGDYCRAGAAVIPQFGMTREQEEYERQQALLPEDKRDPEPPAWFWLRENSAIVLSSKSINRDFQVEPTIEQQLWDAIRTPEIFEIPAGHSVCVTCGETRPFQEFGTDRRMSSGLQSSCKACESRRIAKYQREQRMMEAEIRYSLGLPPKRPGRRRMAA